MKKLTRVIHVFGKMDVGGAESFLMNVYRKIDKSLIQFDFIVHSSEKGFFDDEIKSLGGNIYYIPAPKEIGLKKYKRYLEKHLLTYGPYDIIHSHVHLFSGHTLKVAYRVGIPKRLSHSHTSVDQKKGIIKSLYKNYMMFNIRTYGTHLLACSNKAAKNLFGQRAENAIFVPNAIDFQQYQQCSLDLRQELGLHSESKLVCHIGRFTSVKNHKFLIDVFHKISEIREDVFLILVGDGELKNDMELYAEKINKKNKIFFLGLRTDVASILQNCDIFLFPSFFEGLPLVLVEAQAAKVKSIVSDTITKDLLFTNNLIDYLDINNFNAWVQKGIEILKEPIKKEKIVYTNNTFDINQCINLLLEIYCYE